MGCAVVTMADVAAAAGVARSTVSKALRDDPSISAAQRERVKAVAAELGYRPDPLVANLMAQLHGTRRRHDPHHLAWIDLWTPDEQQRQGHDARPALQGARQRAAELGFGIEVYHAAAEGVGPERLRAILTTRSQWGVIFPPVPEAAMEYAFDLGGLASVAIGTSLRTPRLHRVSHNHFRSAQVACQRLRAKGLARIGLVLSPATDRRVEHRWRAAYLTEQSAWPTAERLPPLIAPPDAFPAFVSWLDTHQPDAVLASEPHVGSWLRRIGPKAPRLVGLALDHPTPGQWGIAYRSEQLGAAAVEMVIGQIHRHERGLPENPHTLLIDGAWVE